jgi:hypothetical protein
MAPPKEATIRAPKGYREVSTGIEGFWKPTKRGETISGIVGHRIEVKGSDGRPNVFFTFKLADDTSGPIEDSNGKPVESDGGMNVGVGGRVLQTFLAEHEGQPVILVFKGMGAAKKGQNAPKLYACFERTPEGEPDSV